MKTINLLLVIILLTSLNSIGQDLEIDNVKTENLKNNIVFGNISPIPFGYQFGYERVLLRIDFKPLRVLSITASAGSQIELLGDGDSKFANISILAATGAKNNHFIYGGGIQLEDVSNVYQHDGIPRKHITYPDIKLGYRYQKPNGNLMFNTGVSKALGIFIGGGFSF